MTVAGLVVWPDTVAIGPTAGIVAALAVWMLPDTSTARPSRAGRSELAVLCELWAAAMDSGLGVGGALAAALVATGQTGTDSTDPTMRRLTQVAGLLQLGADASRSWEPAVDDPQLVPIAAAARRSAAAGADLAATIREQATAVRRADSGAAQRRAGRAGVLMTAPLALCFLPAFICLGLAPVVIALVGTLDIGR